MDTQERGEERLWIGNIAEGDRVQGAYLAKDKRVGTTRNGKPFLNILLGDRTGEVEGKVWNRAREFAPIFQRGDVVEVEGEAESYRGQIQVNISRLGAFEGEPEPEWFLDSARRDSSEMMTSLLELLRDVKAAALAALIEAFLADRGFVSLFKRFPAAKNFHHAYLGGLLEHTLSVCRIAGQATAHYPELDRDLLLTGAFLHDIGKVRELRCDFQIDYTDEGRLLGHLVLGTQMVDEKIRTIKRFPEDLGIRLKHLILSHHGHFEFGSPKRPKFLEAFALHMIDDLDAKIRGLQQFMERDRQEGSWTDFNRLFERFLLKGEILPVGRVSEDPAEVERQGKLF